jgi:hypothetical protein
LPVFSFGLFTVFASGTAGFISPSLGELLYEHHPWRSPYGFAFANSKSLPAIWSLLVQRRVTKETHPGALALRASLAERHLLQGRFDALQRYAFHAALEVQPTHPCVGVRSDAAHPCLSKLKWPSMAISPWQMPLCEATLMGIQNKKKLQQPKTKAKLNEQFPLA